MRSAATATRVVLGRENGWMAKPIDPRPIEHRGAAPPYRALQTAQAAEDVVPNRASRAKTTIAVIRSYLVQRFPATALDRFNFAN
jgi:hypothetical protein